MKTNSIIFIFIMCIFICAVTGIVAFYFIGDNEVAMPIVPIISGLIMMWYDFFHNGIVGILGCFVLATSSLFLGARINK